MSRYFYEIAFDGTLFSGWQRQKNVASVQQTLEDLLELFLRRKVKIHGCGRTDAGVHASSYFFHVDLSEDPDLVRDKMNRLLPSSIACKGWFKTKPNANAQKDAISRTYTYRICTKKNPFYHPYSALILEKLDLWSMQTAAECLLGKHDFQNFCKRPELLSSKVCKISHVNMELQQEQEIYALSITGNRFLHHMVRLIVGHLIKIGKGRESVQDFKAFLNLKKQPSFFELAPAQGLTLSELVYNRNIYP